MAGCANRQCSAPPAHSLAMHPLDSTDYPATAHGALLSGQKAARDLLKGLPGFATAAQGAGPCDMVEGFPAGSNATGCGGSGLRGRRRRLRFVARGW